MTEGKLNAVIAVVDDNESFRKSMEQFLGCMGFQVEIFASAVDFLNDVKSKSFDCAIVDLRMPIMNGLTLQKQMNASGIALPIVIVTAHEDPGIKMQTLEAGACAYLQKPFSAQSLLDAINLALGSCNRETGAYE